MLRISASHRPRQRQPIDTVVQSRLVDALFDHPSLLIAESAGVVAMTAYCWVLTAEPWLLAFATASVLIALGRLGLRAFYLRRIDRTNPMLWAKCFAIGAGLSSLVWGLGSAQAILHSTPLVQIAIITAQSIFATLAAMRSHAVPFVAVARLAPCFGLASLACLMTGHRGYTVYPLFIVLHVLLCLDVVRNLFKTTSALLAADMLAAQANEDLARANLALETMAMRDALTSVTNRRGLDHILTRECSRGAREIQPISLLLVDLDHFRMFNDALGHPAGDACLQRIAGCLRAAIGRPGDVVARYAGEQFAIVLPNTNHAGAAIIAETVRGAVESLGIDHPRSFRGIVTVSVGFATMIGPSDNEIEHLLHLAEEALREAKVSGRNQIIGRSRSGGRGAIHRRAAAMPPNMLRQSAG